MPVRQRVHREGRAPASPQLRLAPEKRLAGQVCGVVRARLDALASVLLLRLRSLGNGRSRSLNSRFRCLNCGQRFGPASFRGLCLHGREFLLHDEFIELLRTMPQVEPTATAGHQQQQQHQKAGQNYDGQSPAFTVSVAVAHIAIVCLRPFVNATVQPTMLRLAPVRAGATGTSVRRLAKMRR